MRRVKVMLVFGTRPEAIKIAPVIKELLRNKADFESVVVVTAQHREMLDQVLTLFKIDPHFDLDIMRPSQELFDVTTRTLRGLKPVLEKEHPHVLLVQGDTTTTFAATLAAFYFKIPIGHIEAGLRTFDKHHPFPEEINRRLTTHLADFHFAPTDSARENLLKEGISPKNIYVTGNTVIDALLSVVKENYAFNHSILSKVDFSKKIITITAHRRESWGEPLERICYAIRKIIADHPQIEVIFSVHLNPKVQEIVKKVLKDVERTHLILPLDYEPFVQLMNKSYLILTDSGGIQEEAPSLGKPVLVLRKVTERPEAIRAGTAKLVGTDIDKIVKTVSKLLSNADAYQTMARIQNPYGDGRAASRIMQILSHRFYPQI